MRAPLFAVHRALVAPSNCENFQDELGWNFYGEESTRGTRSQMFERLAGGRTRVGWPLLRNIEAFENDSGSLRVTEQQGQV